MPVGFKNSTDGNLPVAVNAMESARHPHTFLGIDAGRRIVGDPHRPATPTATSSCAAAARRTTTPTASAACEALLRERRAAVARDGGLQPRADRQGLHASSPRCWPTWSGRCAPAARPIMGFMLESNLRRRQPAAGRAAARGSPTASRSPTPASTGRRPSAASARPPRRSDTASRLILRHPNITPLDVIGRSECNDRAWRHPPPGTSSSICSRRSRRRGAMPVRALVAAGGLFGIRENSVRVALARLLADGLIERDERGAYRLGPRAAGRLAPGRVVARPRRAGCGRGTAAGSACTRRGCAAPPRSRLRRHRRALDWLGFRELAPRASRSGPTTWPTAWPASASGSPRSGSSRRRRSSPSTISTRRPSAPRGGSGRSARWWRATARRDCALERSERRLPALPEARAMVESFQLGGQRHPPARPRPAAARRAAAVGGARAPARDDAALRPRRTRVLGALPGELRGAPPPERSGRPPAAGRDGRTLVMESVTPSVARGAVARRDPRPCSSCATGRAGVSIAVNWGLVAAAFALVACWPNPLTVVVALFVIGARQLGFAILMHEAAHRTLFRNRRLNDWAGNWLCAYPGVERPPPLPPLPPAAPREDVDRGGSRPRPRDAVPDHAREPAPQDLARPLRPDRLEALPGHAAARPRALARARAAQLRRRARGPARRRRSPTPSCSRVLTLAGHPALYLLWVARLVHHLQPRDAHPLDRRARHGARSGERAAQHAHDARALVGAAPDRARTTSTSTSSITC